MADLRVGLFHFPKIAQWLAAPMKNSIGKARTKLAREVTKLCRANNAAAAGMGVPFAAWSCVQRIRLLLKRQITPQTFSIIIQPIPPPTPIQRRRLLSHP